MHTWDKLGDIPISEQPGINVVCLLVLVSASIKKGSLANIFDDR